MGGKRRRGRRSPHKQPVNVAPATALTSSSVESFPSLAQRLASAREPRLELRPAPPSEDEVFFENPYTFKPQKAESLQKAVLDHTTATSTVLDHTTATSSSSSSRVGLGRGRAFSLEHIGTKTSKPKEQSLDQLVVMFDELRDAMDCERAMLEDRRANDDEIEEDVDFLSPNRVIYGPSTGNSLSRTPSTSQGYFVPPCLPDRRKFPQMLSSDVGVTATIAAFNRQLETSIETQKQDFLETAQNLSRKSLAESSCSSRRSVQRVNEALDRAAQTLQGRVKLRSSHLEKDPKDGKDLKERRRSPPRSGKSLQTMVRRLEELAKLADLN